MKSKENQRTICNIVPHRQCGGCKIFLCHLLPPLLRLPLSDLFRARAPPYRRPVQPAAPLGDDGQLMSGASSAWPVLWLSTNAVRLTGKCFPSSVFCQVLSVKRFPSSGFRQMFSVKRFLSNVRHFLDGGVFRRIGIFLVFP